MPESQKDKEEWKKQITWLNEILILIQSKGEVIIDEFIKDYHSKRQLNYTIGDRPYVQEIVIQASLDFFDFYENSPIKKG